MRARLAWSVLSISAAVIAGSAGGAAARGTSPTTSDPAPAPAPVIVVDPGDPALRYDLTPPATPGTSAATTYEEHILGNISGGGVTEPIDERSSATSAFTVLTSSPDGGYSGTHVFTDLATVPDGLSAFREIEPLLNVTMIYTVGADGLATVGPDPAAELTPEQAAAIVEYDSSGVDLERVPTEPVGVGAVWTVDQPSGMDDVDGTVVYTYRLAEVSGDAFRIDVSYTIDFANLTDLTGLEVTGAGVGTATISGSLSQPLAWRVEEHIAFDMVISDDTLTGHAIYGVWRTGTSTLNTPA